MNHANIEKSPRLQRVKSVLKDGGWHSTLDIIRKAQVCAVNSCVAELRANGHHVNCIRKPDIDGCRVWLYRMVG